MSRLTVPTISVLRTIRGKLAIGFGLTVVVLFATAWIGVRTLQSLSRDMNRELSAVTSIGRQLSAVEEGTVRLVTAAQEAALTGRESADRLDALTRVADSVRRSLITDPRLPEADRGRLERVGAVQARLQVYLAVAQAYREVGMDAASRRQAELGARVLDTLLTELGGLMVSQGERAEATLSRLSELATSRQRALMVLVLVGVAIGGAAAWRTWGATMRPLHALAASAERLGKGDLTVRIDGDDLDREYAVVARAFDTTVGQLRDIVLELKREMKAVTDGADALTAASSQAAQTSGQISAVVTEIAREAEGQRRHVDDSRVTIDALTSGAGALASVAEQSNAAAVTIATTVATSRTDVERAVEALEHARGVITASAGDLDGLQHVAESIQEFVATINWVADQTNLLALNAAIEAARAGQFGRGFAVVADEVRNLANASGEAARHVRQVVAQLTEGVTRAVSGFRAGAEGLTDVGGSSTATIQALEAIAQAVVGVQRVTRSIGAAATDNRQAAASLIERLQAIGAQAEAQAAASQQAAAAAQQGAATAEEVAAVAAALRESAGRLEGSVARWRV